MFIRKKTSLYCITSIVRAVKPNKGSNQSKMKNFEGKRFDVFGRGNHGLREGRFDKVGAFS